MLGLVSAPPIQIDGRPKPKERLFTLAEYLRLEETSDVNHEFDNGKLLPMAGGKPEHSEIKASVVFLLGAAARQSKSKCRIYNSDIRIYLPKYNRAVMPDAAVVVGEPEFSIEAPVGLLLNPTLIVEVLSDGTESYDRSGKFAQYRTLPSFREYVLVAQDAPRVETFVKDGGKWFLQEHAEGLDTSATLDSLDLQIPLREIYRNINFEPEKPKKRSRKA